MHLRSVAFSGAVDLLDEPSSMLERVVRRPVAPLTLGVALRRWLERLVAFVIGFAVVLTALVLTGGPNLAVAGSAEEAVPAERTDRVTMLVHLYGCWTGKAPDDAGIPGHAVVTLPGHRARRVPAKVGFAIWLDERPGNVHAFCP